MKTFLTAAGILLACVTLATAAQDIGPDYWVLKKKNYDQMSTADPTLATSVPFQFQSVVEKAMGGTISSGSITPPGSGSLNTPQPYERDGDGSLIYQGYFSSQANLDHAYGSGGYIITVVAPSHDRTVTLSLAGNHYSSVVPKLSNTSFNRGELILNATVSNTLTWNSFSDRGPLDMILVTIYKSNTPVLRQLLPPETVSLTLAPNFLEGEQLYSFEVSFLKVTDHNVSTIPNATGTAGYGVTDRVHITTSTRTPISGLGNISTRGFVGTGDDVLISGFIVTNTDTTSTLRVVARALGPSLRNSGINNPLLDPFLYLYDGQGQVIASNDDWASGPHAQDIMNLGLEPSDSRESALLQDLPPGPYTAIVRGKNQTTGVGLAEIYNLGSTGDAQLANISTRGLVKTDQQVMIGGIIISGVANHQVLARALGPSLTSSGVSGVLADPVLTLYNAQGSVIGQNDDWRSTQQTEIEATGIAPTDDHESAILTTLSPGNYTGIVKGKLMTTGVGLVEFYTLN